MLATTRSARSLSAVALAAVGLVVAAPSSVAAPPTGFFYLAFEDRLPTVGTLSTDIVAYDYVGRRPAALRPRLRLLRNGSVVVETTSSSSWGSDAARTPALAVGDLLEVQDEVTGEVYAQARFNARPAFLQGTCGEVTELAGQRTGGSEISGVGAYDPAGGNDYGGPDATRIDATFEGDGPGTAFQVEFERPVRAGFRVWAEEQYPAADNASVRAFREQRVRSCDEPEPPAAPPIPTPPGAAPAPADRRAPLGTVRKPKDLSKRTIAQLARGATFTVLSDEAGTVDASTTLRTVRKGRTKRTPVGGLTQTVVAGKNAVRLTLSAADRRRIKAVAGSSSARLVFGFKIRDAAGNATTLPSVTLKVPRR